MNDDAIVVEGLQKSYGSVRALCGVDFTARTGSVLGLLGPNGAGKTTFLSILVLALEPTSGRRVYDGLDAARAGMRAAPSAHQRGARAGHDPAALAREPARARSGHAPLDLRSAGRSVARRHRPRCTTRRAPRTRAGHWTWPSR